jgi:capsular exopolysaccharide synthesis family protein
MGRIGDAMKRAGDDAAPLYGDMLGEQSTGSSDRDGTAAIDVALDLRRSVEEPAGAVVDDVLEGTLLQAVATRSEKLVANPGLQPIAVEQYRRLAAILHHAQKERGIRRILVGSALAEEGKTLTATNLALTLSESYKRRVLLIDADLRRPGVNIAFGIADQSGLSEALASEKPQKLSLVQLSDNLSVLPAGRPNPDPMHGLTSLRMAQILDEATEMFDWVIVDSPPVGLLPDAKLLARMVDNIVFVVMAGRTPHGAIQRAIDSLGRERVLWIVLNRVDPSSATPGGAYYRYYGNGDRNDDPKPGLFKRMLSRR